MRLTTLIILFTLLCSPAFAQAPGRSELEKQRQRILESIRQTEDQLEATRKDKTATMTELRGLQNKLAQRQKLIGNINQEISQINNNIQLSSQEVAQLRKNLELLKLRYAQSVRYAYKTRSSYDMLAFLFSSNDFNDAMRRVRYLRKYRDYRKQQADKIRITQGEIVKKIDVLNSERSQKDVLLTAEEEQRSVLQKESNETNKVVSSLKGREKELTAEINKNKKAAKQLDRTINDLIRREIELARKKAEEEQRRKLEEERKRKEDEARRLAAANNGGMSVNTGSGTRSATGGTTTTPAGKPTTTTTTPANKPTVTTTTPPPSRPVEKPSYALSLTPEVAALSNSFEANRGRLPWPVEKGFIAEGFGRHQHAVAEKVTIENNGVDIQTSNKATARAVFDGTVSSVFYIQGFGQVVMVSHGQYFTIYSRLASVSVSKGQAIKIKQTIGIVGENDDGVPMIHFELWKVVNNATSPVDPAGWIAR